jgi:TusA-related sulfurtransferase
MEIDLKDIAWPVSVIRCSEALSRLEPGGDLTIRVCDPDVVHNVVLLINSRPDLRFDQCRKSDSFQLNVHRLTLNQRTGADRVLQKIIKERA